MTSAIEMPTPIIWLILLYALVVAIGGISGYVKAKSKPSLISGLVSGGVLAIAWGIGLQQPSIGLAIATVTALVLAIVFALRFRKTGKVMPAGLLAIVSLLAAGLFAFGWSQL